MQELKNSLAIEKQEREKSHFVESELQTLKIRLSELEEALKDKEALQVESSNQKKLLEDKVSSEIAQLIFSDSVSSNGN